MILKKSVIAIASLVVVSGCGAKKDGATDENQLVSESEPENSTGAEGKVNLTFGSQAQALLLAGEQAQEPVTAVGFSIQEAKFNIAAIKIQAKAEQSTEEKEVEKTEIKEEKEEIAKIEKEEEEAEVASLTARQPKDEDDVKEQRKQRQEKIAKLKTKLHEREKEHLAKQKGRDASIKFMGPYVYDAVAKKLDKPIDQVQLADGSYHRIQFKLRRSFDAAADSPLLGNVFYIKGQYKASADATAVPFQVEFHAAMNFRLKGDEAKDKSVDVEPAKENALQIVFQSDKWFTGVDLTNAEKDADGKVWISGKSNQSILQKIRKNIKQSVYFGKDKDKDGKLGTQEVAGQGEDTDDNVISTQ